MSVKRCSFPLQLGVFCAMACAQAPPDTIYYNAAIVTMSPDHPTAQAVAIRGDRFTAVGSNAEILKTAGPRTQKIDLVRKCVVPGIIETHVHPIAAAISEIDGPVPVMHSIAEIKAYIRAQDRKLPPGRLIFVPKEDQTPRRKFSVLRADVSFDFRDRVHHRHRTIDLAYRGGDGMDVRLYNPRDSAFADEIDFLRPWAGRFQDFSVGSNGRKSIAPDRHGLCRGMIGRHGHNRSVVEIGRAHV